MNDRRIHTRLGNGSVGNPAGRNIRSVWTIPTEPLPDEHYAAYPQKLVERCILAGSSERGCCPECGAPRERIVKASGDTIGQGGWHDHSDDLGSGQKVAPLGDYRRETTGWRPMCSCGEIASIPCIVLDPFLGSGTTALVARRLGRRCIGIELSPRYAEMAARRTRQLSLLA